MPISVEQKLQNNHPKTYGGTKQYNEGICFLREELASHGFIAYEQLGFNWALNKAKNVAITVMAGNSWVGTDWVAFPLIKRV